MFGLSGALGARQKLPTIYHFPKIFFSRTINVYIKYNIIENAQGFSAIATL
jgi:hypothetical protein